MTILRINVGRTEFRVHRSPLAVEKAIKAASEDTGPVIVMIHGYKYRPGTRGCCPHETIFANDPSHGAKAWPRHLGFGHDMPDEGLGIAFAWDARGARLNQVYARARGAGAQLARLLTFVHTKTPQRPIHIITHSMGSEVAFHAVPLLPSGSLGRVICMTGASYRSTALNAMASPAGLTAELINVTSRENDLFDFMFESLVPPPRLGERAVGHGLSGRNTVTLQLDHPEHLRELARLGCPIPASHRRICHWSAYSRPRALQLWAKAMRDPAALPLARFAPSPPLPRWSRLLQLRVRQPLLPDGAKPAT